ncbi:MAG: hypothetical protein QNL04_12170 [SAR324 cluster bacterium]|nr:hypothetical protein [SAR324 cluster bacterium]
MMIKKTALALFMSFTLILGAVPSQAMAQDEGDPAMRSVAFFSLGGGAAGAFFGIALWLLDPLNPSADLTNNALQGFAVGAIGGSIMGVLQLQRQMVLPYRNDYVPSEPNEFEGGASNYKIDPMREIMTAQFPQERNSNPSIPLAKYQFRF